MTKLATAATAAANTVADDLILPVCVSIVGLSLVALALLARPTSWLSRWVDRKVVETLPEDVTR